MAYSTVDDLLLGNIPLGATFSREKFVDDAADEIDSRIGKRYVTPIDVSDSSLVARHSRLLLKRINNFLATGRLILAIASPGEDDSLHAYGLHLVQEAQAALTQIETGIVDIVDAPENPDLDGVPSGPTIANADAESAVDAFYNRVMVPESDLVAGMPYRDWAPGANPRGRAV